MKRKKKILLVEDNVSNVRVIRLAMETMDCELVDVSNGKDALKVADEIDPDLILMDIQLPGMDGFEVTKRLREIDKFRDTPIIVVTASATDRDRARSFEVGGTEYISKPFRVSALREMLANYL